MVMFGNYGVSQSYGSTVAPQNLRTLESTNSPVSEEIASEVQAYSVKTPTPTLVHAEAVWAGEAKLTPSLAESATVKRERGVASAFAHPLSSHEESVTGGTDVDTCLASGCLTDFTRSSEQDVTAMGSSDEGPSLQGSCPPMSLDSADLNPLSPRPINGRNAADSDQEQTLLAQSQRSAELPELSGQAELAPDLQKSVSDVTKRENGAASVFAHPLSSHEESVIQDAAWYTLVASECMTNVISSEKDGAPMDCPNSRASLPGPSMPMNSTDLNPLTHSHLKRWNTNDVASCSTRKVQVDSSPDSDQDQTMLAPSQSSTELPDTCSQNIPTLGKAESREEMALAKGHPATTNDKSTSSSSTYDFVMWYHDLDEQAANCIYGFLEGSLQLHGFMYSRDKTLGAYELKTMDEAIQSSDKVLLFITPRSKDCGMFEAQMHTSLKHSIQSRRNNIIPIFWDMDRREGPSVVGHIYGLNYCGFSEKFKLQIAKVFVDHSPSSSTSHTTSPCSVKSGQSTNSVNSPNLRKSQSVPTPEKPKGLLRRFFSLGKK